MNDVSQCLSPFVVICPFLRSCVEHISDHEVIGYRGFTSFGRYLTTSDVVVFVYHHRHWGMDAQRRSWMPGPDSPHFDDRLRRTRERTLHRSSHARITRHRHGPSVLTCGLSSPPSDIEFRSQTKKSPRCSTSHGPLGENTNRSFQPTCPTADLTTIVHIDGRQGSLSV